MKMVAGALMVAVTLCMSDMAVAGDAAAGKTKSEACVGCHGMNGHSNNPNNPNLAGQKKSYLIKAMKDYKDGKRQDPMMSSLMAGLTDADMENLAEFYSTVK
ncbi:MAG: cytochrome c [Gammaproteobacteria bacterium]|nr:cytochrome c [Gammaproteobacteria bacterium]